MRAINKWPCSSAGLECLTTNQKVAGSSPAKVSVKFFLSNGILYKRNHDSTLLRCMDKKEAEEIMEDMHDGLFGTHSS